MAILDKLIEKKDLSIYIDFRIEYLNSIKTDEIMSRPEKERGLIQERFNGRILELEKLKDLLCQNKIKDMGKTYFDKYAQAVRPKILWLKDAIAKSNDGKIKLRIRDVAKSMGPEFEKKQDKAIYWGIRFVLFHEGIVVGQEKGKDGEELLIMRMATSKDVLPRSLARFSEPSEDDVSDLGTDEQ